LYDQVGESEELHYVGDDLYCHHDHCECNCYSGVGDEQDEKFAVAESDAVLDPGAMMIEVQDALATGGAMMASFGLEDFADDAISLDQEQVRDDGRVDLKI
jgi:hypothetical protein